MSCCRRLFVTAVLAGIVFTVLLVLPPRAAASIGFQPVSADELKMASEPKAPGAPAIILYRQVDREDDHNRTHEDHYMRIKILTEEGRDQANVQIRYLREFENVINIHGRTIRPDGSIINFEGKPYDKTVFKSHGFSYLAKAFTLPDVQVGSIIEYGYTITFQQYWVFDSRWVVTADLFTRRAKFTLKPLTSFYEEFNMRWTWQWISTPPKRVAANLYTLELTDVPGLEVEENMPPEDELRSRIDFMYSRDQVQENVPERYWKKASKDANGRLEAFANRRGAMQAALTHIVSNDDSPSEKARKIYARVQQFRNLNYEQHRTEQEKERDKEKASQELENAEDVWKGGYGTEQQLSFLFLALVRAAGIEAHGLMVADRSINFFHPEAMNEHRLNAFVVVLRLEGKDVYCDPGIPFAPFGQLPWQVAGSPGLSIARDGGAWITTPLPSSADSQIIRKADLTLADDGSLEGRVVVTYTGLDASGRRFEHRHDDETARTKILEEELRQMIPVASEATLTNHPDWNTSTDTLVAEFSLKIPGYASFAGRRILLQPGIFGGQEKHVFEHEHRAQAIYFEYPSAEVDEVTLHLPEAFRAAGIPEPLSQIQPGLIGVVTHVEAKPGQLHLSRKFSNDIVLLKVENYRPLQSFYRMVRSNDEEPIVLSKGN